MSYEYSEHILVQESAESLLQKSILTVPVRYPSKTFTAVATPSVIMQD